MKGTILILLLVFFSIFPRIYLLKSLPPTIVDEPANLRDIQIIFKEGFDPLAFHWDFSRTHISHLPAFLLIKFFPGQDETFLLRLASVIISLLSIPAFFLIVKRRTNVKTAFLTSTVFSLSYYFLQFSRVGWNDVVLVMALGLYIILALDIYQEKSNKLYLIVAGILAALSFYLYKSSYIVIATGFVYLLIIELINSRKINIKRSFINLLIFTLTFVLISLPWLFKISQNWERYTLRTRVVAIQNVVRPYHGNNNFVNIFLYQTTTTAKSLLLFFPMKSDNVENTRYLPNSTPPINFFVGIMFWIGLVYIVRGKLINYLPFLVLIFLSLVFGQILTVDPPNGARALVMLPSYYVVASQVIFKILDFIKDNKVLELTFVFFMLILAIADCIFYFNWVSYIKD